MVARIYQPSKTAMQSGKAKTKQWVLERGLTERSTDPLMGYTSSSDMLAQVKLKFSSQAEAENYAKKNGIEYVIVKKQEPKRARCSYSDNFKYGRLVPWTH